MYILLLILTNIASSSIIPMTVDWDDDTVEFYNDIREITIDVIGFVPVIGDVAGIMLDLFWPEASGQDDIYDYVEQIIDEKILEIVGDDLRSRLDTIREEMAKYQSYLDDGNSSWHDAGGQLKLAIDNCMGTKHYINTSKYHLELFPYMVPLSVLHLTNLREQYLFGEQLHMKYNDQNTDTDTKDLNETYIYYKNWFQWYYPKWYEWRNKQIKTNCWQNEQYCDYQWSVKDKQTHKEIYDEGTDGSMYCHVCDDKKVWMDGTKMAMMNELQNYQIHLITPTFYLHQYVPWLANDTSYYNKSLNQTKAIIPDSIPKTISFGPYIALNQHHYYEKNKNTLAGYWSKDFQSDKPGIVKAVVGRHGRLVDAIQVQYTTHNGQISTDSKGGNPYEIHVNYNKSWITSFYLGFGWNKVATMEIGFNNGTLGKVISDHDYRDVPINCTMGSNDWMLTSIAQIGGKHIPHHSKYDAVKAIRLDFTHRDYLNV